MGPLELNNVRKTPLQKCRGISFPFAPSLRVVSRRGRGGLGARIPAKPCSFVPFAPSLRVVSRRGRRGLGARIPAKSCSFVAFAPSLRVVSRRGRRGLVHESTQSLVLPLPLHQVCGLFQGAAAGDLVHESPQGLVLSFPLHQVCGHFRTRPPANVI